MNSEFGIRIGEGPTGDRCARGLPHSAIRTPHSGLTLIELLVVIAILAILLGAAIPVLSPASDARRIREASRGLNSFIAGAKVRAKETGRPFGIALKKLSQETGDADANGACLELYYVEQPPPYAGFDSNARVRLSLDRTNNVGGMRVQFVRVGSDNSPPENNYPLPPGLDYDPIPALFRIGDIIEVAGRRFVFTDTTGSRDSSGYYVSQMPGDIDELFVRPTDSPFISTHVGASQAAALNYVDPDLSSTGPRSNLFWTKPLRYKIHRQPVKTSNEPYQLPESVAIDLEASGFGDGTRLHQPLGSGDANNASDVIVMFTPEGAIAESYFNTADTTLSNPTGAIVRKLGASNLFLLVGMRENIPAPPTDFSQTFASEGAKEAAKEKLNWLSGDSRWVVVGAQTGTVATAENAFVDPAVAASATPVPAERRYREIVAAREFARQSAGMGGR